MVRAGRLVVEVLPSGTTWVGVTHPDDIEPARTAMSALDPVPLLA